MSQLHINKLSPLEVPQQQLAGEGVSSDLEFKLARACLAQCFVVAEDLLHNQTTDIEDLVSFIDKNGANTGSDYYSEGEGWRSVHLASLIRSKNMHVVVQDMRYDRQHTDIKTATEQGRVNSDFEKSRLNILAEYGGLDRSKWIEAIEHTIALGGIAVSSIDIPLLAGDGFGRHAVLITNASAEEGTITYFDPDAYNILRYGSKAPQISRADDTKLIYSRPSTEHASIMSGTVTHLFKSLSSVSTSDELQ